MKRIVAGIYSAVIVAVSCVGMSVSAERLTSPNYVLESNIAGGFGGTNNSSNYKMTTVGGEAIVGNGASGSYKLMQPLDSTESYIQVAVSNAQTQLGTVSSGVSQQNTFNINVRTGTRIYGLTIQQDHNLQTAGGAASIPSIGATTSSPQTWVEGSTIGLGYSVVSAPLLDAKWSAGAKYAAVPNSPLSFYNTTNSGGNDSLVLRMRLDVAKQQTVGSYSNLVTITGTTTP